MASLHAAGPCGTGLTLAKTLRAGAGEPEEPPKARAATPTMSRAWTGTEARISFAELSRGVWSIVRLWPPEHVRDYTFAIYLRSLYLVIFTSRDRARPAR